ncbi:MAG: hypothetical protein H6574_17635 [Lewinellaceae bacterium]|nr:hypothetical protein [Lewinellaceae bacterium]
MLFLKINPDNGDVIFPSLQPNWHAQYTIRGLQHPTAVLSSFFRAASRTPMHRADSHPGNRTRGCAFPQWVRWSGGNGLNRPGHPVCSQGTHTLNRVVALQDGSMLAIGLEDEYAGLVLRIDAENGNVTLAVTIDPVTSSNDRRFTGATKPRTATCCC